MNQIYKSAVAEALESVKDIEDSELKKSGFEILLKKLIDAPLDTTQPRAEGSTTHHSPAKAAHTSLRLNKTGLSEEEIETLFEVDGDTVTLKVKPTGSTVAEKQIALAHALLIGYKATLGQDNVSSLAVAAVAREWNIWDTNLSKKIQAAGYIQAKGIRKAAIYSLKPGAIDKLCESMQKMARGE